MLLPLYALPSSSPSSGLISRQAISRAKGLIRDAMLTALDDEVAFDKWFGAQVTRWVSVLLSMDTCFSRLSESFRGSTPF